MNMSPVKEMSIMRLNNRHVPDAPARPVMRHDDDSAVANAAARHDPISRGRRAPHRFEERRGSPAEDDGRH
jgi:hypothetical protein